MAVFNRVLFCLGRGEIRKKGVGSLQSEIVGRNAVLLGAEHSMRAENAKKERERKKVDLVFAVVLSHCHCFFLTTSYDRGRQHPQRWRHTLRNRNVSVHVCRSCINTILGVFKLKTHTNTEKWFCNSFAWITTFYRLDAVLSGIDMNRGKVCVVMFLKFGILRIWTYFPYLQHVCVFGFLVFFF